MTPGVVRWWLLAMLLLGAAVVILVLVMFVYQFGSMPNFGDSDERARIGEFVGGVTGPVLSYLTIVGLILTLLVQIDILQDTREQLVEARRTQGRDANTLGPTLGALFELTRSSRSSARLSALAASLLVAERLNGAEDRHDCGDQGVAMLKEICALMRELSTQDSTMNPPAR